MKILFAGGAGYIGSVLVPVIAQKHDVTVVDLCWFGNHLPSNIKVVKKNLFDLKKEDLESFEQIVFLGGLSNDPMAEFSPHDNFVYNAALPAYLAFIAKQAGVKRFVYAGSCSVYGYTEDKLFSETDKAVSNYPYGISKLQGEFAALQLVDDTFSAISLRQGTLSGYSPRMRLDIVVNTMFRTAMQTKTITVNNPKIWRPVLGTKDMIDAYSKAIEAPYNISGIFNVASENFTVLQIAEQVKPKIESSLGTKIELIVKDIADYRNYKVSTQKAKDILGFAPQQTIADIVEDLILNFDHFKDFSNPQFYNIEVFKSIALS